MDPMEKQEDLQDALQGVEALILEELEDLQNDLQNIRLPEEWVNDIMTRTDAERREKRAQARQLEDPEPLPDGFIETAAGFIAASLLRAGKEKDIAAAVEAFIDATEYTTPQRARELYAAHYAQKLQEGQEWTGQ